MTMTTSYTHSLNTPAEQTETRKHLAKLEQELQNRADLQKTKIQLVKTVDSGDMHNGPENNPPETRTVSRLNLLAEFQRFFDMGDYNLHIRLNAAKDELTIETGSTYHLSSAWLEQKLVYTLA